MVGEVLGLRHLGGTGIDALVHLQGSVEVGVGESGIVSVFDTVDNTAISHVVDAVSGSDGHQVEVALVSDGVEGHLSIVGGGHLRLDGDIDIVESTDEDDLHEFDVFREVREYSLECGAVGALGSREGGGRNGKHITLGEGKLVHRDVSLHLVGIGVDKRLIDVKAHETVAALTTATVKADDGILRGDFGKQARQCKLGTDFNLLFAVGLRRIGVRTHDGFSVGSLGTNDVADFSGEREGRVKNCHNAFVLVG